TGQPGQAGAQAAQQGVPGMLVEGAEDSSSMLVPLRFSVDVRTNSITAIGGAAALNVVEAVLLNLDESDIRQRQTDVYRLKNSYAPNVSNAISQFLQTQRQAAQAEPGLVSPFEQMDREVIVVPETTTNSLLISATPRYFKEIFDLVVKLDRTPRQVLIQALIVEVQLTNTDEWGMEVGLQDSILFRRSPIPTPTTISSSTLTPAGTVSNQQIISESATPGYLFNGLPLGNNTFPGASNPNNLAGQIGSSFSTGLTNGSLGYGGLVLQAASENINLLLRALAARTRVDVLSRPQIRALDNQPAAIQVGQEVPRINGFTPSGTAGVITPTVQQRSIGIILTVTPRISPDGLVVMEVVARRDSLSQQQVSLGFSAAGTTISSPIINTTNAQTVIGVNSGQTVVLGGMITKQDNVEERKVPLLGDIPVLGKAFRYDFKQMQRTELLIFLTPRIVNSDEEAEMFKQIEVERLNFIESEAERMHGPLFGLPKPSAAAGPGRVIDDSRYPPKTSTPSDKKKPSLPTPPEPGSDTNSPSDSRNGLYPMPDTEAGDGPGASLMRNDEDDDEDLEAAFIQTNYRVPQKAGQAAGRARVGKPGGQSTGAVRAEEIPANSSAAPRQRQRQWQGGNRKSKLRQSDAEES
ncbi:MAG: type II secretion system protein GspD, partial [Deltaproteobacteria bacterium]